MQFYLNLALVLTFSELVYCSEQPCGDWEPFKDEKCFKIFDKVGTLNFTDSEMTCGRQGGAKLVTISSIEEQTFLFNYFYNQNKVVDNVWLGARFDGKTLHWKDGPKLTYSNWASGSPKNRENYCLEMRSEVEGKGKWADEPCAKKNLVVCQKEPSLSLRQLKRMLYDLRIEYRQTLKEQAVKNAQLEASSIPPGFIYVQLPKSESPSKLWPSMTWSEVSSEYAGVFFRVTGKGAADFGYVQEENAPRLTTVSRGECMRRPSDYCGPTKYADPLSIPSDGTWSDYVKTSDKYVSWVESTDSSKFHLYIDSLRFRQQAGEVRPRNMAVRVWKRTA